MSNPPAHRPPSPEQIEHWRLAKLDLDLFFGNIDLILAHTQAILDCDQYFFCAPAFAIFGIMCSTQANVGSLLLGYRSGLFIDICQRILGPRKGKYSCGGKAYIFKVGGQLSRSGWGGWCSECRQTSFVWDGSKTFERWDLVSSANRQMGQNLQVGIIPFEIRQLATVEQLVSELQSGSIRPATAPDKTLVKDTLVIDHYDRAPPEEIRIKQVRGNTP